MWDQDTEIENFLSSVIRLIHPDAIYDLMLQTLVSLLHPDGLLLMFNKNADRIYHITRSWGDISFEKDYCFSNPTVTRRLLASDSYIPLNDDPDTRSVLDLLTSRKRKWLIEQDISAIYCLKYSHALIGFLFIARHDHKLPDASQVRALDKISYYAAHALRNANLYQNAYRASITDDLTSLYNRKHAFECIGNRCLAQTPCALILLDIDDFKLYNELYGSREGDSLIHRCAQLILQALPGNAMAFRFGADEFLVLWDTNDMERIRDFADRLVDRITHANASDMIWDMKITCGISSFPDISGNASLLLHNAEQAVYFGKLEGKGHTTVYQKGLEKRAQNPDMRAAYERVAPTIYALTAAIDAKDNYTFVHSMNVSKYAVALAEAIGMSANDIEIVRNAGMLHDIGKISIPEHILKKTTDLTDEEYAIMKTHVENSTKMIRYLPNMDYVIPAVVAHHERYDGTGYPRGLAGEEIPLMGRILTIADCFDAMTARRPYKQPMPVSYAVEQLQKNSGTQFDPELVKCFITLIEERKIAV